MINRYSQVHAVGFFLSRDIASQAYKMKERDGMLKKYRKTDKREGGETPPPHIL